MRCDHPGFRVDPKSLRTGVLRRERRGRLETHKPRGESQVKTEGDNGVMCPKFKAHHNLQTDSKR